MDIHKLNLTLADIEVQLLHKLAMLESEEMDEMDEMDDEEDCGCGDPECEGDCEDEEEMDDEEED
jgi:hypothetical protein